MARCRLCGRESKLVSSWLGVCSHCLREKPGEALELVRRTRRKWRLRLGLTPQPPKDTLAKKVKCQICVNECEIPEGGSGYCGIWRVKDGKLQHIAGSGKLLGFTYLDPLPTNCVSTPVCPAATSRGYPDYTDTMGPEYGYYNLAVFMGGCPLDCAFCQNWEHKLMVLEDEVGVPQDISTSTVKSWRRTMDVNQLVQESLDEKVRCVCYFGGDPTPQAGLLVAASKRIVRLARYSGQRFKRICWETDGLVNPVIMREMAKLSLETGGIVKIDWKAWSPSIYEALTGVDGERAVERLKLNARIVARLGTRRRDPPLLVVSILLVPGYVGPGEVYNIASYLASLDKNIPLVLLAFHPDYKMLDLPTTSIHHAEKAVEAARKAGIDEVYLGNKWLLRHNYVVEEWWS